MLVTDVVVLIDREQGGEKNLNAGGLTLHSAFKLTEILSVLQKHSLVTDEVAESTRKFLADNQVSSAPAASPAAAAIPARYAEVGFWLWFEQENGNAVVVSVLSMKYN